MGHLSPKEALAQADIYYSQLALVPDEGDLLDTASDFLSQSLGINHEEAQARIIEYKETDLLDELCDKLLMKGDYND